MSASSSVNLGAGRQPLLLLVKERPAAPARPGSFPEPLPWPPHAEHPPHRCLGEDLVADSWWEQRRGCRSQATHLCHANGWPADMAPPRASCKVLVATVLLKAVLAQSHSSSAWHLPSSCNQDINCWSCYMAMFIKNEKQRLDCTFPSSTVFSKAISQTVFWSQVSGATKFCCTYIGSAVVASLLESGNHSSSPKDLFKCKMS